MRARRPRRRDRLAPDVLLQSIDLAERGVDGCHVRDLSIDVQPRGQVPPERVAQRGLQIGRDQIDPEIRGPDRVGLLDDQVPALVEAVRGTGERERDEESEEREDRAA